jgi:hypothetical protein
MKRGTETEIIEKEKRLIEWQEEYQISREVKTELIYREIKDKI